MGDVLSCNASCDLCIQQDQIDNEQMFYQYQQQDLKQTIRQDELIWQQIMEKNTQQRNQEIEKEESQMSQNDLSADNQNLTYQKSQSLHSQEEDMKIYRKSISFGSQKQQNVFQQQTEQPIKAISHFRTVSFVVENPGNEVENGQRFSNSSPNLKIKIIQPPNIEQVSKYLITPYGCQNSLRNAKDQITYFGSEQSQKEESQYRLNDIIIQPLQDNNQEEARHFKIWYDLKHQCYKVQDLGKGCGVFVKIQKQVELKSHSLINIGKSYLSISLIRNDSGSKSVKKIENSTNSQNKSVNK